MLLFSAGCFCWAAGPAAHRSAIVVRPAAAIERRYRMTSSVSGAFCIGRSPQVKDRVVRIEIMIMGRMRRTGRMGGMGTIVVALIAMAAVLAAETPGITIDLATGSERERRTKITLEHLLTKYDLKKYTVTN